MTENRPGPGFKHDIKPDIEMQDKCPYCGKEYVGPWHTCKHECGPSLGELRQMEKSRELQPGEMTSPSDMHQEINYLRAENRKLKQFRDELRELGRPLLERLRSVLEDYARDRA